MVRATEESPLVPPTGKNGKLNPMMVNRSVRDVLFLIIFVLFLVGMGVVAIFGFDQGNPDRLMHGTDYEGDLCGIDKPEQYLYWLDPLNSDNYYLQKCLSECPNNLPPPDYSDPENLKKTIICKYGIEPAVDFLGQPVEGCFRAYNSESVLYRCVPLECPIDPVAGTPAEDCDEAMDEALNSIGPEIERMMNDISESWPVILAACGFALVIGFFWLLLVRLFSGLIVWLTLIGIMVSSIALTAVLYIKSGELETNDQVDIDPSEDNQQNILYMAYAMTAVSVILFFLIVFMAKRINFSIGIIKEATRAVSAVPGVVIFPFFVSTALSAFIVYWIYVALYLASAGEFNEDEQEYEQSDDLKRAMVYHLFGLLWIVAFIIAVGQTTLAITFSTWYWTAEPKNLPSALITRSLWMTLKYHTGSVAFGSLILAIVQMIRIIFEYIYQQFKQANGESKIVKIIGCCIRCCLSCFERFIQFLNKNAYIMIAMRGTAFCEGAQEAFEYIMSNILRVGALSVVGDFFLFLGKLFIACSSALFAYLLLDETQDVSTEGNAESPLYPTILVFIIAYAIGSAFMAVYEMAIDTLLLCFCVDERMNDGTALRPYFMSDSLREFVKEHGSI
eukprot:TRINITY_DN2588_c0_g1_i1.p1 TRINITY_DN2588_c0_g1~~TRINITY_DN2588_c0_g1_i1.p1  ORF type:complete len:618 (-),score=154.63 TRINITY_DN2588_c0_g1_i1:157-2010(-)